MTQTLNSNTTDAQKIIDEQFNPRNVSESAFLQDLVEEEMRSKGLDPLNNSDLDVLRFNGNLYFL